MNESKSAANNLVSFSHKAALGNCPDLLSEEPAH